MQEQIGTQNGEGFLGVPSKEISLCRVSNKWKLILWEKLFNKTDIILKVENILWSTHKIKLQNNFLWSSEWRTWSTLGNPSENPTECPTSSEFP